MPVRSSSLSSRRTRAGPDSTAMSLKSVRREAEADARGPRLGRRLRERLRRRDAEPGRGRSRRRSATTTARVPRCRSMRPSSFQSAAARHADRARQADERRQPRARRAAPAVQQHRGVASRASDGPAPRRARTGHRAWCRAAHCARMSRLWISKRPVTRSTGARSAGTLTVAECRLRADQEVVRVQFVRGQVELHLEVRGAAARESHELAAEHRADRARLHERQRLAEVARSPRRPPRRRPGACRRCRPPRDRAAGRRPRRRAAARRSPHCGTRRLPRPSCAAARIRRNSPRRRRSRDAVAVKSPSPWRNGKLRIGPR